MINLWHCFLAAVVALSAAVSQGATKTYVGPAGQNQRGEFDNPANWNPAGVPGEDDDVVISKNGGNYGSIVSITSNVKVASLTLAGSKACALALFATNTGSTPANVGRGSQVLPDANDTSEARFEVTGNVTISASGRIIIGKDNWKRAPNIVIGGNLTSNGRIEICAGNTNETLTAETGTGFFTVKGDATLTSGAVVTPVCNTTHGGGIVFSFRNLDLQSGASFYAEGIGGFSTAYAPGYASNVGGSYGGRASSSGNTYGEVDRPYLPGSSSDRGTAGGAIRIVATNFVLNGTINANGLYSVVNYGPSGGAVWIRCKTLSGAGSISADGGYQASGRFNSNTLPGGGGRIALDVEDEPTGDFALTLSAAPSICKYPYKFLSGDVAYFGGEAGTVWASKFSLIKALLPKCKSAVFHAPDFPAVFTNTVSQVPMKAYWHFPLADEIVFANDVTFKAGSILGVGALGTPGGAASVNSSPYTRFIGHNQKVVFLGDVVTETNTCIMVNSTRSGVQYGRAGTSECVFAGDFTQGGSLLAFGQGDDGTEIKVGGDWTMKSTAGTYPICDLTSGKGVHFDVAGAFSAEASSLIYATGRGYGTTNSSVNAGSVAPGQPGRPNSYENGGGAYGGKNYASASESPVYGNQFLPVRPGSNGKYNSNGRVSGGGAVWIRAKTVSLAGRIEADGLTGSKNGGGSSSGGGVFVTSRGKSFAIAPTASITAKGGSCTTVNTGSKHNGGGGRIALGIGVDDAVLEDWLGQLAALGDVYAEVNWSPGRKVVPYTAEQIAERFPGATFSAAGGSNTSYSAEDGTVCIYEGPRQNGSVIYIQ